MIARDVTHLPPLPCCEFCTLGRAIEPHHANEMENDTRPITLMDFVMTNAEAEDSKVDEELGTFWAVID